MRLIDANKLECVSATMPHEASEDYKEGYGDGMNYVLDIIDDLPTIDPVKWIPVSERLPEEEKMQYWVCTDTGYQCQCRWTNDVYGLGASDRWEWKIFDIPQYSKVVAWMPLPKPWKGEEDEHRAYRTAKKIL